jgi:hypothetical protein
MKHKPHPSLIIEIESHVGGQCYRSVNVEEEDRIGNNDVDSMIDKSCDNCVHITENKTTYAFCKFHHHAIANNAPCYHWEDKQKLQDYWERMAFLEDEVALLGAIRKSQGHRIECLMNECFAAHLKLKKAKDKAKSSTEEWIRRLFDELI